MLTISAILKISCLRRTNAFEESVYPKLLANEHPARLIKLTVSTVTDF